MFWKISNLISLAAVYCEHAPQSPEVKTNQSQTPVAIKIINRIAKKCYNGNSVVSV